MKIDTHHHLWDMATRPQSWMTDEMKTQIEGPYDMRDWEAVAKPEAIDYSIAVQTVPVADETPELLATGVESKSLAGVVGWLDVTDSRFRENLDALRQLPGGNKLVGLRELAEYHPDSDWMSSPTMHEVARALGEWNLTLDLLVLTHQIPAATKLVKANPDVRFVLDHLAKPSLEPADLGQWSENLRDLASFENVACKFSGYAVFD
ncbi:MAG: amidohydrolase family protein, partial [Terrimesophilobacter sp.]